MQVVDIFIHAFSTLESSSLCVSHQRKNVKLHTSGKKDAKLYSSAEEVVKLTLHGFNLHHILCSSHLQILPNHQRLQRQGLGIPANISATLPPTVFFLSSTPVVFSSLSLPFSLSL